MIDDVGEVLAAAWSPPDADARVYVLPQDPPWKTLISWLVDVAIPSLVPAAARRARVHAAFPDGLLTRPEKLTKKALETYRKESKARLDDLEREYEESRAAADEVRDGLLYGKGDELKAAVQVVLESCGFEVEDLDKTLGRGKSADLLLSREGRYWLTECRGISGNAGEEEVYDARKHYETWSSTGRTETLAGGVIVLSHNLKHDPLSRPPLPLRRGDYVRSLPIAVVDAVGLFQWWANLDCPQIHAAFTSGPKQYGR